MTLFGAAPIRLPATWAKREGSYGKGSWAEMVGPRRGGLAHPITGQMIPIVYNRISGGTPTALDWVTIAAQTQCRLFPCETEGILVGHGFFARKVDLGNGICMYAWSVYF